MWTLYIDLQNLAQSIGGNKEAQEGLAASGGKLDGSNAETSMKANTFAETYTWPAQRESVESTDGRKISQRFLICSRGPKFQKKFGTCKGVPPGLESGDGDRKLGPTAKKIEPTTLTKPETNSTKSWQANLENIQKPEKGKNGGMLNEWGRNYRNSYDDP